MGRRTDHRSRHGSCPIVAARRTHAPQGHLQDRRCSWRARLSNIPERPRSRERTGELFSRLESVTDRADHACAFVVAAQRIGGTPLPALVDEREPHLVLNLDPKAAAKRRRHLTATVEGRDRANALIPNVTKS